MTKSSIEAYLQNIESGRANSQSEKVIQSLMQRKFASTYELSQDLGVKTNTVGARLNTMLSIGCVFQCGEKVHNGTSYTVYMWVDDPDNWEGFGKVYRKKLAMRKVKSIVDNPEEYSTGMIVRAQLEAEKLHGEINQLMWGLPEADQQVA